jgi:hypothetical protein
MTEERPVDRRLFGLPQNEVLTLDIEYIGKNIQ